MKKTVAVYDYRDEAGVLLYQKVRFAPKAFSQRRPDGHGGWLSNLTGTRRVLYRLDELKGREAVVLCEGEADADRLRSLGIPATTTPDGAKTQPGKNWRPEYTEQLVAAGVQRLAVIPDNDQAGQVYAGDAATACHAADIAVRVVTLRDVPPKGDVSDWLDDHERPDLLARLQSAEAYEPDAVGDVVGGEGGAGDVEGDRCTVNETVVPERRLTLTSASTITIRPVTWLLQDRLALGTMGLLGGREGVGKSVYAYTQSASITRGTLQGAYFGTPRAVIVAATEDSWEHTIVPRLMAADADLDLVYRVDVETTEGTDTTLSLPRDLPALEQVVRDVEAALILLDPLLSRLAANLDTHKDADVRRALEPLVALADRTGAHVLGLIHVNKTSSTDPLTLLMASRAFAAVARAVLFVMVDPEDESTRLIGTVKNNLGRMDPPTRKFQIVGAKVADTEEGPVWTGKLEWLGESDRSIREAVDATAASAGNRTATDEAAAWLQDYLVSVGGTQDSNVVRQEGDKAGHSKNAVYRAMKKLRLISKTRGFPRKAYWSLPPSVFPSSGGAPTTGNTGNSGNTDAPADAVVPVFPVVPVVPVGKTLPTDGNTGETEETDAVDGGSTYREF